MKVLVFDTETTSLEKPFCYNIGYVVYDTESKETVLKRDYVVEQVWHNLPLFESVYYHEKRPLYVSRMRARTVVLNKFGYICMQMIRDIKDHEITQAYAYNSAFDEKVFAFCCEWFKVSNPLDLVSVYDIRGYVHKQIAFTKEYQAFCEEHALLTENENYSTTAESVQRYITQNVDFNEEHTALADSEIELNVLLYCVAWGCEFGKEYKVYRSIPRQKERTLTIVDQDHNETVYTYTTKTERKGKIYLH